MHFAHLKKLCRTLRARLIIWITVAVMLMMGIAMLLIREEFHRALSEEFDHVLKAEARDVSSTLRNFDNPRVSWEEPLNRKASRLKYFIEVFDESGKKIWNTEPDKDMPMAPVPPPVFPPDPLPAKDSAGNYLASKLPHAFSDTETHRIFIRPRKVEKGENPKPVLWFRIGISKEPMLMNLAKLDRIMLFAGLGMFVLTPLGAYILAGRATHPLAKIIATTARLDPENLHERLHIRGTNDELDQLSETINGMLDRIATYIDRHRDFIADAAHELRSPLTAIRSSVEVALNRPRSTEEYQTLLFDVMEECSGLAILVNRLLFLAEADAGRLAGRDQVASLEKLVRESVDMFHAVAEIRGIQLEADTLDPAVVPGDELYLRQVVRNLIDNAIKFTKGPGRVSVAVRTDVTKKQVLLTVSDTGSGIPAEDLPRIFDRFYRADKSRRRHDGEGGFGLGLSICQVVVRSLGGEIKVESQFGRGSTFTVILPLSSEPVPAVLVA